MPDQTLQPTAGDNRQRIMDAMTGNPGSAVALASGNYGLSAPLTIPDGSTLRCVDGSAVLRPMSGNGTLINVSGSTKVTLDGFSLDGGGVNLNSSSGVGVRNLAIRNIPSANYAAGSGIYWANLQSSVIEWNTFENIAGFGAIYAYSEQAVVIQRNLIRNSQEGIHLNQATKNATGCVVSYNVGTGIERAWLELQDTLNASDSADVAYFVGLIVQGNHSSNFTSKWQSQGGNIFSCAHSLPMQFSTDMQVTDNYCDDTSSWSFELCGRNMTVTRNTAGAKRVNGVYSGNICGIDGRQNKIRIFANTFLRVPGASPPVWGMDGTGSYDNAPLVDVLPAVAPPAAGAFQGSGTTPPPPIIINTGGSVSASPINPSSITVVPVKGSESTGLRLEWAPVTPGTLDPKGTILIERKATDGTGTDPTKPDYNDFLTVIKLAGNYQGLTDAGLQGNWKYTYRLTYSDAAGVATTSVTAGGQTKLTNTGGAPTPPPVPPISPSTAAAVAAIDAAIAGLQVERAKLVSTTGGN